MYVSERSPRKSYRRGHIAEFAVHQNYIGCIYGNVGTCTYCNPHICSRQSRSIVYSVAYHYNLTAFFELRYDRFLAVRFNAGDYIFDTCLLCYGFCDELIITRKHNDFNSHVVKFPDSLRTFHFNRICHGNDTGQSSIFTEVERSLAFL